MTNLIIIFYFLLITTDLLLFFTIRDLLFSFLLTKRNRKTAQRIHKAQSFFNRFSFNYVKEHATYQKEYRFFHIFYIANLCLIPIQYLLLIILGFFSISVTLTLLIVFWAIKLIFNFALWTQQNSNRVFRFDKHYK